MDWREHYKSHLTSAAEAVNLIKSGDRVCVHHACAEPTALIDAMVANAAAYRHVEIVHMVPMGTSPYCAPGMEEHFIHNCVFAGGSTRKALAEGRADYTPIFFHQFPDLLRTELVPDVALVHVCPPDEHGYCSMGVSIDYSKAGAESAKTVIAQVNPNMPRTLGDTFIHVSKFAAIVEVDSPIIELPAPKLSDVEMNIGEHCASLINDGDTLQLGIGAIPDAVLRFLTEKKDLGIHSEMFSDGVVELIEAGVVNNSKKTYHPGLCVVNFLMGTRKLYDYVHNNPAVYMAGVDYVNHPLVIAKNDNLVSINSCVQVDLQGQIVSSSAGLKQISGIGGQADFVRGAAYSKGGRSIMAFPSIAKGGISKIVPFIDEGSSVSTLREDADYIVTEYGIAAMHGASLRQRAQRLIAIAHPDVRAQLQEEYERRFATLDAIDRN
ncbi:MAG: hypothetical protein LBR33_01770 [Propionibacteriaceae bacterium]|jgi:4-hydroxybutyrate CoA-transferase|nr:hypothetical protein [Propionibacteriaceae bacterium]